MPEFIDREVSVQLAWRANHWPDEFCWWEIWRMCWPGIQQKISCIKEGSNNTGNMGIKLDKAYFIQLKCSVSEDSNKGNRTKDLTEMQRSLFKCKQMPSMQTKGDWDVYPVAPHTVSLDDVPAWRCFMPDLFKRIQSLCL